MSNVKYAFFTNKQEKFSISVDLLPFEADFTEPLFCDMDTSNLRAVLNYYRNKSSANSPSLQYDLNKFEEEFSKPYTFLLGHRQFYSTKETLAKLPYFKALFSISQENYDPVNIDRDPLLFEQILTILRHPLQRCDKTAELQEEAVFWGIASPKTEQSIQTNVTNPLRKLVCNDVAFNAVPDFSFFELKEPQITLFAQNFFRYMPFQQNNIVLKRVESKDQGANEISFEFEVEKNIDIIASTYLQVETTFPFSSLSDLFENISVDIEANVIEQKTFQPQRCVQTDYDTFEVQNDNEFEEKVEKIHVQHSAKLLEYLSFIEGTVPFTVHRVGWKNFISVPMRFFFCKFSEVALLSLLAKKILISFESEKMAKNTNFTCSLSLQAFTLSEQEKEAIHERINEQLIDLEIPMIQNLRLNNGSEIRLKLKPFDSPTTIRSFYFIVYDLTTKRRVDCTLDGHIKIGESIFYVNVFQNQQMQYKLCKLNSKHNYDPSIWIYSFSITNATIKQPNGHFSISEEEEIHVNLSVLSECENIAMEIWASTYQCLLYSQIKNEIGFLKLPTKEESRKREIKEKKRQEELDKSRQHFLQRLQVVDLFDYRPSPILDGGLPTNGIADLQTNDNQEDTMHCNSLPVRFTQHNFTANSERFSETDKESNENLLDRGNSEEETVVQEDADKIEKEEEEEEETLLWRNMCSKN